MFIPTLMLFILGLGVPVCSLILGFVKDSTPGWGWVSIMVISVASIAAAVVIYVVGRLQKPEE